MATIVGYLGFLEVMRTQIQSLVLITILPDRQVRRWNALIPLWLLLCSFTTVEKLFQIIQH